MRSLSRMSYLVLGLLILSVAGTAMMADCPAIVRQALEAANEACATTGRNQICYGYGAVSAEFQPGYEGASFSAPGDVIDAAAIQTLTSTTSDDAGREWGVALMRLQLNQPAELPDQNVTFLIVGDVSIENTIGSEPPAPELPTLQITGASQANIRSGPSRNDGVVGSLAEGDTMTADGRNADGTWVRIQLSDGQTGWVFAELVAIDGDINTLSVVEAEPVVEEEAPQQPMSNFNFHTGGGESACAGELPSGVVIQSPNKPIPAEGSDEEPIRIPPVMFTMNNVDVLMGSTLWAEAEAGGSTGLAVVEDYAQATANQTSQFSRAGGQIEIPADDGSESPSLNPDWSLTDLEPLVNLFENLEAAAGDLLARTVDPAENAAHADDNAWADVLYENHQAGTLVVEDGFWVYERYSTRFIGNCPMNKSLFAPETRIITLDDVLQVDNTGVVTGLVTGEGIWPLTPSFPGQYIYSEVVEIVATQVTIWVRSPLYIEYDYVGDIDDGVHHCQIITPIVMMSCLIDVSNRQTRGDGFCPAETHRAMGTYGR